MAFLYTHTRGCLTGPHGSAIYLYSLNFFVCFVYSLWYLYCPGNLFFLTQNFKAWRIFWWNFHVCMKVVLYTTGCLLMELGYFNWCSEWLWAGWLRNSIPSSGKVFSPPQHPDWFWDPPSLPFIGYWDYSFQEQKVVYLHVMLGLGIFMFICLFTFNWIQRSWKAYWI